MKKITFLLTILFFIKSFGQTNNCNNNGSGQLIVGSSCNLINWNSTNGSDYWDGASTNGTCNEADLDDAWGWFDATSTSTTITYNPDTQDAILTLFEGACNQNGTAVACLDDGLAGDAETIIYATTIGTRYRVRIQRWNSNGNMNGQICIYNTPSGPSNDDCANATVLTVNSDENCTTILSGTTTGATDSTVGGMLCNGFTGASNDDVWYSFLATAPNHQITVTPNTLGDFVIDLRSGACDGTNIACADDVFTGSETINATGLTIGNTYYVRIYSYDTSGGSGTFDICVTTPGCTPSTDTPDHLYISTVSFLGTLKDTTNSSTYTNGYEDYTGNSPISKQVEGEGVNIYVEGNEIARIKAWVDWNSDGYFDDVTELIYDTVDVATISTTFGFVIPLGTPIGDYRLRVRNYYQIDYLFGMFDIGYDFNACKDFVYDGFYLEDFGEAEDYLFTVEPYCNAIITSITDGNTCGPGSVTLDATATGTPAISEYRWYTNETDATPIAITSTGTWNTPSITTTTTYWVSAYNGTCESWVRTPIVAHLTPIPTLTVTPDTATRVICGENNPLEISAEGDVDDVYLIDEDFENGSLGAFSNVTLEDNGTTINNRTRWQNRTSTFVPNEEVWHPAISSGFGPNQFVISNSDVGPYVTENALTSISSYDTSDYTNLTLSFKAYYSHYLADNIGGENDYVAIEVSTNGTLWTAITPNITADVGIGTKFETLNYNLNAYINQPTLSIRLRFYAVWADGIAIDDIKLYGDKDITAVNWTTTPIGAIDLYEDSEGTTPYTGDVRHTVYAIPNISQLEEAQFDFTINGSFANGCGNNNLNFTVSNNTRIWSGVAIYDWDTASNWKPAMVPTADNCVIIDAGTHIYIPHNRAGIPPRLYDAYARNVDLKAGAVLEVVNGNNLTVTEAINIDGSLDINDNASLIQINNIPNTGLGSANIDRVTPNGMDILDYTYWSSAVTLASNFTLNDLSPNTPNGLYYRWQPSVGGNHGNWISVDPNITNMQPGLGYIVRAPSDITNTDTYPNNAYSGRFEGIPNNGNITTPISIGSLPASDDDNWNLIGNPYPSAIDIVDFLDNPTNIPLVDGTVYLWTRNSPPTAATPDPFYGDFVLNYTENDYASVNYLASTATTIDALTGGQTPSQFIASGQAFFVRGLSNGNAVFNNTMRVSNENNIFFRRASNFNTDFEKHRLWLNLSDNAGGFSQIVIGYADGATLGWDRGLDGLAFGGNAVTFYSLTDDNILTIQGRPLPFDDSDVIPLGFISIDENDYRIGIDHLDDLFINQPIYLEDTYTGTIHDIKSTPYLFSSIAGTFNDRFILRYRDTSLGIEDLDSLNGIIVFKENEQIVIKSDYETIKSIDVYDILGRTLFTNKYVHSNYFNISSIKSDEIALFLKIKLIDGKQKIAKIIF